MKLGKIIILVVLAIVILQIILGIVLILFIGWTQKSEPDTFLLSSTSPDGTYILEAYRTEPGATVDYSIKVYVLVGERKKLIYNAYHEANVVIEWCDSTVVEINGKRLDLSAGEIYDWRSG